MSWCLGADYYRGSYTIADSIITIVDDANENVLQSNMLLIREDGEKDSLGNIEKSIYQLDPNKQIMPGATAFRVTKESQ